MKVFDLVQEMLHYEVLEMSWGLECLLICLSAVASMDLR